MSRSSSFVPLIIFDRFAIFSLSPCLLRSAFNLSIETDSFSSPHVFERTLRISCAFTESSLTPSNKAIKSSSIVVLGTDFEPYEHSLSLHQYLGYLLLLRSEE